MSRTLDGARTFFGFDRTSSGIIHVRTDGERILGFTHSGRDGMNEVYWLNVDGRHRVTMAKPVKRRR